MADKILYLFNSASRPTYKDNLYRILALPIGGVIQFRYTLDYSVPQDLRQELKGYEALIVFVDRFSKKAYNYHPIRRGKVLEDNRIQNRLIIKCQLLDYCYTNDIEEFTKLLKKTIKGIPELRKRDSRITSDGFYVQLGTRPGDAIINDSERWHEIVDSIYQTPAFNSDPTTFLKLSVKSEKAKSLTLRGNDGVAFIKSDNTYSLEIFYYDPDMGNIDKNIAISFKEPLEKYGPEDMVIYDKVTLNRARTDRILGIIIAKKDSQYAENLFFAYPKEVTREHLEEITGDKQILKK